MKVNVNNNPTETSAVSIKQLAEQLNLPSVGVAVAVNNTMVPRTDWENTAIVEGSDIVIVKAFCGG